MYIDNIEDARDFRLGREQPKGVRPKKLDFLFYWRALVKNRKAIITLCALSTTIAFLYAQTATPIYSANTTLLLESQKANIISIDDLVSSEQESIDYYGTQLAILRSRALAETVFREILEENRISQADIVTILKPSPTQNLAQSISSTISLATKAFNGLSGQSESQADNNISPESAMEYHDYTDVDSNHFLGNISSSDFESLLDQFRSSLSIYPVAKSKLVTVVYQSSDPTFAALSANAIAKRYIESVLERRQALKNEASAWMDRRITELKKQLDSSENALLDFKESNGLIDVGGNVSRLKEQELLQTSAELSEAKYELSNATDLYREVQRYRSTNPQLLETLPFVQSDILVRSVMNELGEVQRDLFQEKNRYGEKHPGIIDLESRLSSLRATLTGHIDRLVATFENDYQLLRQKVSYLEEELSLGKENIQLIGQQKITLDALLREVNANRDQYNQLYDRITETRTAEGIDEANAVIAEAAWVPSKPVSPNKPLIIGLSLFLSMILAAAYFFIKEYLDDTVSNAYDIEHRLRSKLLGVLPLVKVDDSKKAMPKPLTPLDIENTSGNYIEAVNTCRTALAVKSMERPQVLLVTSSVQNEGKSTVALNLSYSFGQLERTLLIDSDLRKPSIAKALGLPASTPGLTNLLLKEETDCLRSGVLGSFDCLTSGPLPQQPLETLSSQKFRLIIDKLGEYYDRIIIDSAPTLIVSDALVLSKLATSVLYVVKPNDTSIGLVEDGLTSLIEAGANIAGICISQVDLLKQGGNHSFKPHGMGIGYHGYGNLITHKSRLAS